MRTINFWLDSLERAVKSAAQGLLAGMGGDGLGLFDLNWGDKLSVAALMFVASVLTSIVSAQGGTAQAVVTTYEH